MDSFYIFFDAILSIVMVVSVNVFGSKGLPHSYENHINLDNPSNSLFNIGYRVFGPIVALLVVALVAKIVWPDFDAPQTFWTICFYWLIRLFFWILNKNGLHTSFLMFICQASLSILICVYLYETAMEDPIGNLMPQSSDISFEFALIIIFVFLQALSQSAIFQKEEPFWKTNEKNEKMLFEFERNYYANLPMRFKQDIVLRILLYTIALTENHYRPKRIRNLERLAAKLGLKKFGFVKTTGLMQVKSEKVLTDQESVDEALPIIERIYDEYLQKSNNFMIDPNRPNTGVDADRLLLFGPTYYSYDLDIVIDHLRWDLSPIYGRYSGSNLSNPVRFFNSARNFVYYKEYEEGSRRVEVAHGIPSRFSNLPISSWCRIGKEQGFASIENCRDAAVFSIMRSVDLSSLVEEMREHKLDKSIALLCGTIGRVVVIVKESNESDLTVAFFEKRGFDVRRHAQWNFLSFLLAPQVYLNSITTEDFGAFG